jgi:hypothetical protein
MERFLKFIMLQKCPRFSRLLPVLSSLISGFGLGAILVGFAVDKAALGQVFLLVLRPSPVNNISLMLHNHIFLCAIEGI